jgi:flagellar hook-associated protein FlgK
MFSALDIASSGMGAAETILSAAANNVANLNTPNYREESVELAPAPGGGVEVLGEVVTPAPATDEDAIVNAIEIRKAQNLYDANAAVVQAQEQMFGSLINLLDTDYTQPPEQSVS